MMDVVDCNRNGKQLQLAFAEAHRNVVVVAVAAEVVDIVVVDVAVEVDEFAVVLWEQLF